MAGVKWRPRKQRKSRAIPSSERTSRPWPTSAAWGGFDFWTFSSRVQINSEGEAVKRTRPQTFAQVRYQSESSQQPAWPAFAACCGRAPWIHQLSWISTRVFLGRSAALGRVSLILDIASGRQEGRFRQARVPWGARSSG
jgi:hypothetical protein